MNVLGIYDQAYADVLILVIERDETMLARLMRFVLSVVKWCREVKLSVDSEKTVLINFTNRYKVTKIESIRLFGRIFAFSKEVKYIGVILDSKLKCE